MRKGEKERRRERVKGEGERGKERRWGVEGVNTLPYWRNM